MILIVLLTISQTGQAQLLSPTPAEQPVSVYNTVASQTSSPNNYALLQPIATQAGMVEPAASATNNKLMQSGLLQPIRATQSQGNRTAYAQAQSSSIEVTPVSFKRGEFDRHTFKLQNVGSTPLQGATVLLKAPAGSLVQQVVPKPDSVDGSNVIMSVGQLAPGAHATVDIMIENPSDAFARFDSVVLTENGSSGSVRSSGSAVVQYQLPRPSAESTGMLRPQVPAQKASVARPVQEAEQASSATTTAAATNEPLAAETYADSLPSGAYQKSQIYTSKTKSSVTNSQPSSTVKAWIVGPGKVSAGEEAEFSIEVDNTSSEVADGVIVQLSMPENMKVTVLDRAAWYDKDTKKISWKLSSLENGASETIRYRGVFKTPGTVNQSIVVGLNQTVQCTSSFQTTAK